MNGLVGFKPSNIRWLKSNELKLFNQRESLGFLGVNVEDLETIDKVITS